MTGAPETDGVAPAGILEGKGTVGTVAMLALIDKRGTAVGFWERRDTET